jgi:hypothetical protein
MTDLYDADALEWSEHQARLLRQHATGQAGNEAPDWANIIEEIESVGRSELHAVRSNLVQALIHDLKCEAWPLASQVPHWRAEARVFRGNAADLFAPSMRQRIDMDALYRRALRGLPETMDGLPPLFLPAACEATLDQMLHAESDLPAIEDQGTCCE